MSDTTRTIRPAPEGWMLQRHLETFSGEAGPFYYRAIGGPPGVGFFSEPRHGNLQNIVHGGALLTLADMALFDICFRAQKATFPAVTASLTSEFLAPAPIGVFIEADGEMMKGGKSLCFCRGVIRAEGRAVMSFAGILKRLS